MTTPRLTLAFGLALAALLAALPATALAHSELTSTDPAADSVLAEPPTTVTLTFSGELDPDGSTVVVSDADGSRVGDGGVDLDVADRNVMAADVDITEDGAYTVEWTAVAQDGHPAEGSFAFTVGAATDDASAPPDTAMEQPARELAPVGFVLLFLAIALVCGRPMTTPMRTANRRSR